MLMLQYLLKMKRIRIAIAEDHEFVRQGFVSLLKEHEQLKIVFDVNNGHELLQKLKEFRPQIILLDIEMPLLGGLQALEKIQKLYPKIKVIIISQFTQPSFIAQAFKHGAKAFLPKSVKEHEVVKAILTVNQNKKYSDPYIEAIKNSAGTNSKFDKSATGALKHELTERELKIITLIRNKNTTQEIADILNLKKKTIEAERSKIFRKTNVQSALELIEFAIKNKLIEAF